MEPINLKAVTEIYDEAAKNPENMVQLPGEELWTECRCYECIYCPDPDRDEHCSSEEFYCEIECEMNYALCVGDNWIRKTTAAKITNGGCTDYRHVDDEPKPYRCSKTKEMFSDE